MMEIIAQDSAIKKAILQDLNDIKSVVEKG